MSGLDFRTFADFMDGRTARLHRVEVTPRHDGGRDVIRIALPDGSAHIDWPLQDLRQLPDQADKSAVILGRAGDKDTARLILRETAVVRQLQQICPHIKRIEKTPNLWRRLGILSLGAFASVALMVFVLVPFMADRLAVLLPVEGERALGDSTFEQIRRALDQNTSTGLRICETRAGNRAIEKMTARLDTEDDIPYPLNIFVLNHDMVNAFALPGGTIVLFRGLINDAESPEELAAVLGHEMGHVVHRDPTRLALRSAGSIGVLGLLFGDFAGGAAVLFLTERLIQANYSRDAEARADDYVQDRFAKVGLPSARMADFFVRLHREYGSDESLLSHLASHPDLQSRADKAVARDVIGNGNFQPVLSSKEWRDLRSICD